MNLNPVALYNIAKSDTVVLKPRYLSLCLLALMTASITTVGYAEENNSEKRKLEKNENALTTITVYAEYKNDAPVSRTSINRENMDKTGVTDMAGIVKYLPLVNAPFSVGGSGTFF